MGMLAGLKALFSTQVAVKESEAIDYNGFSITPAPMPEGSQFRVAATITKGEGETQQVHRFIRSDVLANREECIDITIRKAKMAIDQSADNLFN